MFVFLFIKKVNRKNNHIKKQNLIINNLKEYFYEVNLFKKKNETILFNHKIKKKNLLQINITHKKQIRNK